MTRKGGDECPVLRSLPSLMPDKRRKEARRKALKRSVPFGGLAFVSGHQSAMAGFEGQDTASLFFGGLERLSVLPRRHG